MKKIKGFFVNLTNTLKKINRHQILHVVIGVITPLLLWSLGVSFVMALLCGALAGLFEEIIYCYAPLKVINFCKISIKIPDFKKWKDELKSGNVKTKHSFENENYKYNFIGLSIFIIIIILLKLL